MKTLKITFLLPLPGTHPIGGFKVVYEYANYLAARGHAVSVVHPAVFRMDRPLGKLPWKEAARTVYGYVRNKMTGEYRPDSWFAMSPGVKLLWVPSLAARYVPEGDVVIATAWETAEWAAHYGAAKGRKFYLIQHLETWSGPTERVLDTWKMPLEKIVITRWLQETAEEMGETAHLIHNGLDFARFGLSRAMEGRDARRLLMVYHSLAWKGSADGLAAFELARQQEPELRLTLFGMTPRPANLPAAIEYHFNPSQEVLRGLYNEAAIFLSPSWTEGFGLPAAEALQCGAAIGVTDIPGSASYAIHEETALLSPPKHPQAMADNIVRLVRDEELRLRLARAGHAVIQQFTWEAAGAAFERVLLGK